MFQSILYVCLADANTPCNISNVSISINVYLSDESVSEFNICSGVFMLEENRTTNVFTNRSSFKIIGNGNTTIECKQNAGLAFKNVSDIAIQNITFYKCGMIFNSTSEDPKSNSTNKTLTSKAAILFEFCTNVSLISITVNNSDGVGIQMYNTIGKVNISHSNFFENKIRGSYSISGGGGLYIEFSLCDPGTNGNNCSHTIENFTTKADYEISNSNFVNNTGSVTNPEGVAFLRSGFYTHFAFGRGGGLSVYLKGNASHNNFTVDNCKFEGNGALFGAGMFVELQDKSNHNTFIIQNSMFLSNKVISSRLGYTGTSGGGAMIDYVIFSPQKGSVLCNTVTFNNTIFKDNAAYNGGGLSFHASKENNVTNPTNALRFDGCHWLNNKATLGAAIDLGILHSSENGQLVKPQFRDCTFINNTVAGYTIDDRNDTYAIADDGSTSTSGGYWPGVGAMYLDGVTVDFSGNVNFKNNTGGAVVGIGAGMNVHRNAFVEFRDNRAEMGGALYLSGHSWISVSRHVQVSFINNSARVYGGAIYYRKSGEHDLMSSANCFIRYVDDTVAPYNWENVKFQFLNNYASTDHGGDAIYTTTVVDCAWNGSFSYANDNTLYKIFLDWPNFTFQPKNNYTIQTAARSVKYKSSSSNTSLKITPGKIFYFPFKGLNDFGNVTSAIFTIFSSNEDVIIPNPVVQTGGSTSLKVRRKINSTFYLQFETVDNRKHVGYIAVTVEDCPMGFILNSGVCECITMNKSNSYEGVDYCSFDKLEIYIRPGYWAGLVEQGGFFSTYACPFSYCIQTNHRTALNNGSDVLCKNRAGRLCGECKHGYGLSVGTLDCVNCTGSHFVAWIILIATTYIPITIVFISLLILNMNLAVGPIHSFIFFCQVFPAISLDNNHWGDYNPAITIISDIHSAVINIMSLRFNMYFTTNYCLSFSMKNMDYYLLQYASSLYPLVIMAIILCIIRYCPGCIPAKYLWYAIKHCVRAIRERTSIQQTVIHGFIAFLLLTYANFVNTSFQILAFAYFEDNTGNHKSVLAPFRQGTMEYFGKDHWPYALVAICLLLIFGILPLLLLILYPFILMIIAYFGWDDTSQVRTLRKWIPLYKLMPVLDTFWSDFKPNCQVFAGFYFLYRFLAFSFFALIPTIYQIYFAISILFMIVMFLHAFVQPYNKQSYNRVDFFMFAIISIINALYAYEEFLRTQKVRHSTIETYLWIRTLLAWAPVVFIVCYTILKIRKHCRRDEHLLTRNQNDFIEPLLDRVDYDDDEDDN